MASEIDTTTEWLHPDGQYVIRTDPDRVDLDLGHDVLTAS